MKHLIAILALSLSVFSVEPQKSYTLAEFLNSSDAELIDHKQQLDKLIAQQKLNLPQSQAMLFYPDPISNKKELTYILDKVENEGRQPEGWYNSWYNKIFQEKKPLYAPGIDKALNDAMKTENKENAQGHIVLYHSTQPNLYAQSYLNTQLQKLALELKGKKIDTETLLMRDLNKPRSYEAEKAKRKELFGASEFFTFSDHPESEYLISTNPAVTSNTIKTLAGNMGESTLYFFLKKQNFVFKEGTLPLFAPRDNKLLDQIIKKKTSELSDMVRDFNKKTNTGVLLQFIVKDDNLARKIIYNAQPFGVKNYLSFHGQPIADPTTDPTTILKTMRINPAAFKESYLLPNPFGIQSQQARIVITGDKLLDLENPAVKEFDVKAYTGSEKSLKEFQQKVDATVQKIRDDYFAKKQQMSWPERLKYRTIDFFNRRQSPWEQKQQYKRMVGGNIGNPFV